MQCVSCDRKPIISSCASIESTAMWRKPRMQPNVRTSSIPSGVLRSVGVMMKLASENTRQSANSTPERSRPAIGCAGTNSTSGRSIACTAGTMDRLTPVTSVITAPGWKKS